MRRSAGRRSPPRRHWAGRLRVRPIRPLCSFLAVMHPSPQTPKLLRHPAALAASRIVNRVRGHVTNLSVSVDKTYSAFAGGTEEGQGRVYLPMLQSVPRSHLCAAGQRSRPAQRRRRARPRRRARRRGSHAPSPPPPAAPSPAPARPQTPLLPARSPATLRPGRCPPERKALPHAIYSPALCADTHKSVWCGIARRGLGKNQRP